MKQLEAISCQWQCTNSDCEEEEENKNDEDNEDFVERAKVNFRQMKPNEKGLEWFSDWGGYVTI